MIPGVVHRSPSIYLRVEENPRETSVRRSSMKAVRPVIASNRVSYFQMRIAQHVRKRGGKKKGKDRVLLTSTRPFGLL